MDVGCHRYFDENNFDIVFPDENMPEGVV